MEDIYKLSLDAHKSLFDFDLDDLEAQFISLIKELQEIQYAVGKYRSECQSFELNKQKLETERSDGKQLAACTRSRLNLTQTAIQRYHEELVKARKKLSHQAVGCLTQEKQKEIYGKPMMENQKNHVESLCKLEQLQKGINVLQTYKNKVFPCLNKVQDIINQYNEEEKKLRIDMDHLQQLVNKEKKLLQKLVLFKKHSSCIEEENKQKYFSYEKVKAKLKAINKQFKNELNNKNDAGKSVNYILEDQLTFLESVCQELQLKCGAAVETHKMTVEGLNLSASAEGKLTKIILEKTAETNQQENLIAILKENLSVLDENQKTGKKINQEDEKINLTCISTSSECNVSGSENVENTLESTID